MGELWRAILAGSGAGLLISMLIGGPVFLMLLKTSIEKGFLVGLVFALGILTSDSVCFFLAYVFVLPLKENEAFIRTLGGAGGLVLILLGLNLIFKKPPKAKEVHSIDTRGSLFRGYIKGFVINIVNPGTILYWVSIMGGVISQFGSNPKAIFAFFLSCMTVIFSTDVLKSFLSVQLKSIITPTFMHWLNRVSGIVLLGAGGWLIYSAVVTYMENHNF